MSVKGYLDHVSPRLMTVFRQVKRQPLAIFVDACIIVNAYTLASLVLFARWAPLQYYDELLLFLPFAVIVHCTVNLKLGLYRAIGRYAGLRQALKTSQSAAISAVILLAAGLLIMHSSPLHMVVMVPIGGVIAFVLMSGVRFFIPASSTNAPCGSPGRCPGSPDTRGGGAPAPLEVTIYRWTYGW